MASDQRVSSVDRLEQVLSDVSGDLSDRERLLGVLERVRDIAFEKLELRNTKNADMMKWARIIIQSCTASNSLLRDKENEELDSRLRILEAAMKIEKEERKNSY